MKKTITILFIAIIATLLLASCSSGNTAERGDPGSAKMVQSAPMPNGDMSNNSDSLKDFESGEVTAYTSQLGGSGIIPVTTIVTDDSLAEKIIYKVNADIETVDFDQTINSVYTLLTSNKGFIESSNVGGRNYEQSYRKWQTYRTAQFTLRIPKDRLNTLTASLETLGNVTSLRSEAENVTAQFTDTQSRLNSLKTQETRILEMLSKSNNVTEMMNIEGTLADIRYQIEVMTSSLRNMENQVDYSSVYLSIREVEVLTEITPEQEPSYWQQIGDGFVASARGVGNFFKGLFKIIVICLPVLIVLAVIAIVTVIIVKMLLRRRAKRIKENPQRPPYQFNPQYPQYPQYQQYPPNPQDPQYLQNPQNLQGAQSSQSPQNLPNPQNLQGPQNPQGSQNLQSPQNPQESQNPQNSPYPQEPQKSE